MWRNNRQIIKIITKTIIFGEQMNISKRQEQILELLRENGFVTVENLSKSLFTSPASIRRDLTRLEDMCFIKRTHGGASVLNDLNHAYEW